MFKVGNLIILSLVVDCVLIIGALLVNPLVYASLPCSSGFSLYSSILITVIDLFTIGFGLHIRKSERLYIATITEASE